MTTHLSLPAGPLSRVADAWLVDVLTVFGMSSGPNFTVGKSLCFKGNVSKIKNVFFFEIFLVWAGGR